MFRGDTIAAISSSAGPAARMIVRLSGPDAFAVARAVVRDAGWLAADRSAARRAAVEFAGITLPAWLYVFVAPHSYTGENIVEFHIPGNPPAARLLLGELLRRGARQAEAGEFTARAYFSGRMALDQAEGVAAVIAARGEEELSAARQLLTGELARVLRPIADALGETLALVETGIDFAEEDIVFLKPDELRCRIDGVRTMLTDLLRNSARFERLSHEPQFVLAGRPNAGKSTLLNALCGAERAVVSPVAGTTRDVIWAEAVLARGLVRIVDAAGLAETPPDEHDGSPAAHVARQMHNNALRAVAEADFVVLVHDLTDGRPPLALPRRPDLLVLSKSDLRAAPADGPPRNGSAPALAVAALTGAGMDMLRQRLDELAFGAPSPRNARLALNARHLHHIEDALGAMEQAMETAQREDAPEIVAMFLREALDALGAVVGRITPEDLLQRIFATFCIGK